MENDFLVYLDDKSVIEKKYKDYDFKDSSNFIKGCLYNVGINNYEKDINKAFHYFWKSYYEEKNSNGAYLLGLMFFRKYDYENAFNYFDKCLMLDPNNQLMTKLFNRFCKICNTFDQNEIIAILYFEVNVDKSIKYYMKCKNKGNAYNRIGMLYINVKKNNYNGILYLYYSFLENNMYGTYNLGWILYTNIYIPSSIKLFNKSGELGNSKAYGILASIYCNNLEYEKALYYYFKAEYICNNDTYKAEILNNIGMIYLTIRKDEVNGKKYLNEAIKLKNTIAYENLKYYNSYS